MAGICYVCGKALRQAVTGKPVAGVERTVDGNPVRMHKTCAGTFDADQPVSARAATTGAGDAYADDTTYADGHGMPVRLVHRRGGE